MSTQERVNRELRHPRQHRSAADELSDALNELREPLRQATMTQALTDRTAAQNLLAACDPVDVANVLVDWLQRHGECTEFSVNTANLGFAVRELSDSVTGHIDDLVREA